ncbi:MAG: phosphatase PAP2 family protein [Anaerolineae bacterium]
MDTIHDAITTHQNPARAAAHSGGIIAALYLIVAGIGLMVLALAAHTTPYFDVDLVVARAVQSIQAPWFDLLMRGVGWPGYPPQLYVGLALIFLILFFYASRWAAVSHLFATVGIGAVGLAIKMLVDRPRPSASLIQVANPNLDGGKYSFAAGHVESYVAILGFLWFLAYFSQGRSIWRTLALIVFGVMIALIGLARIYSGEHWFSDVAGGYLLGSIWLVLTIRFYNWGKSRFLVKGKK